jgi:predicted DNA-binding protein (MmcQ/YjbR family)
MDGESARDYLRKLPQVEETIQWGENLVFWVGDKAIGGKMFAVLNLDADGMAVMSFAAGAERYHELLETDGVVPAPYLARIYWVAVERWGAIPGKEVEGLLRDAREMTYAKLPQRVKDVLALSTTEYRKLVTARRKLLAERAEQAATAKAAAADGKKAAKKAAKTKGATKGSRSR